MTTKAGKVHESGRGRDIPRAWRSSYVRREHLPTQGTGAETFAQLLAVHTVGAQMLGVVRRIEAWPWLLDNNGNLVLPSVPDAWHSSGGGISGREYDWGWNLGLAPLTDKHRLRHPGFIIGAQAGNLRERLADIDFPFCDWQRLASSPAAPPIHHIDFRAPAGGPKVIQLWAIVTLPSGPGKLPQQVFGQSFGSLEGLDVPIDRFYESEGRWLLP